ncbi:Aste57867_21432 [Aphanomyces stellatus]|uniref:Aste57867_21432 protein n=1 Tax=Aphanomyces stellatus TaxID=120398 RepID=A0A485LM27_9STRA|nr:hypothetical protein As57867_021363 [Aphanomyces stellatus]VFT98103.1 Aste57867_21432 [Aphanomyces stellatus]
MDSKNKRLTACNYCDSSLSGRGNPVRMTRHLARYCLQVPQEVKHRAEDAIQPSGGATASSRTAHAATTQHSDDMDDVKSEPKRELEGSAIPQTQPPAWHPHHHQDHGHVDHPILHTAAAAFQDTANDDDNDDDDDDVAAIDDVDEDGRLLSQYMAPTADELFARALVSSNVSYDAVSTPEWIEFFHAFGYAMPPQTTVDRLASSSSASSGRDSGSHSFS